MSRDFLMLGLSGSGKTTFLAALNWALQRPSEGARLRSSGLADATEYINDRTGEWLKCQVVLKTPTGVHADVSLPVETLSGDQARLRCPDLSGEEFRDHWESRQWSIERDREVRKADGLVLFVSALHSYLPVSLAQESQMVGGTPSESEGNVKPASAWLPEYSCLQVQVVELLQFIRHRRRDQPLPVAVVVSAWDRTQGSYESADQWLAKEAPLLWQVLQTNMAVFPFQAYGVSAQGGEYDTDTDQLLKAGPTSRITVVHTENGSPDTDSDLSRPLAWLLLRESAR